MTKPQPQRKPARTASKVLRALFEELDRRGIQLTTFGDAIRRPPSCLQDWKNGIREPKVTELEALFETIGWELQIVPLADQSRAPFPLTQRRKL